MAADRGRVMRASGARAVARRRALDNATLCLLEPLLNERLGRGKAISPETADVFESWVDGWSEDHEEAADLMEQAWELAGEAVEVVGATSDTLSPGTEVTVIRADLASGGGRDLPADELFEPSAPRREPIADYDVALRHRLGHGIVGAALTGKPVSVGFAGLAVPQLADPDIAVRSLLAGQIVDVRLAGKARTMRCGCWDAVFGPLLEALGISADVAARQGTLGERLTSLGRKQEVEESHWAAWQEAGVLVDRAMDVGLVDRYASLLHDSGRLELDPAEIAMAVGPTGGRGLDSQPIARIDLLDDLACPSQLGDGAAAPGVD